MRLGHQFGGGEHGQCPRLDHGVVEGQALHAALPDAGIDHIHQGPLEDFVLPPWGADGQPQEHAGEFWGGSLLRRVSSTTHADLAQQAGGLLEGFGDAGAAFWVTKLPVAQNAVLNLRFTIDQ